MVGRYMPTVRGRAISIARVFPQQRIAERCAMEPGATDHLNAENRILVDIPAGATSAPPATSRVHLIGEDHRQRSVTPDKLQTINLNQILPSALT